jgi:hypothetical protein
MNLPPNEQLILESTVRDIVGKYVILIEIALFFFGSRTQSSKITTSDIDIGIERVDGQPIDSECMQSIRDEIAFIPLLYKIDIVDFAHVTSAFKAISYTQREEFNV